MKVSDLTRVLDGFAPLELASDWDNVGLLIGDPGADLGGGGVMLTIDLTEAVIDEAIGLRCGAVVAYHPPIFHPIKRITTGAGSSQTARVIQKAIRAGMAVYSPHTALDAAPNGLTDWLADCLFDPMPAFTPGSVSHAHADRRALRAALRSRPTEEVKIVTFVPQAEVEKVRGALASAGAGMIGGYTLCSFASDGVGTFLGGSGTNPAVGAAGRLEQAKEVRLEMVCSRRALALAVQTLAQFHPYEEPAIDIYPLEKRPEREVGIGRRIVLDTPATLEELCGRLKRNLGVKAVQLAAGRGASATTRVSRIALVPGAGASVAPNALGEGCEVFVTGEMKHHEVVAAVAGGMSVILAGHTDTERGYLPRLAEVVRHGCPGLGVHISSADRNPLVLV